MKNTKIPKIPYALVFGGVLLPRGKGLNGENSGNKETGFS